MELWLPLHQGMSLEMDQEPGCGSDGAWHGGVIVASAVDIAHIASFEVQSDALANGKLNTSSGVQAVQGSFALDSDDFGGAAVEDVVFDVATCVRHSSEDIGGNPAPWSGEELDRCLGHGVTALVIRGVLLVVTLECQLEAHCFGGAVANGGSQAEVAIGVGTLIAREVGTGAQTDGEGVGAVDFSRGQVFFLYDHLALLTGCLVVVVLVVGRTGSIDEDAVVRADMAVLDGPVGGRVDYASGCAVVHSWWRRR